MKMVVTSKNVSAARFANEKPDVFFFFTGNILAENGDIKRPFKIHRVFICVNESVSLTDICLCSALSAGTLLV